MIALALFVAFLLFCEGLGEILPELFNAILHLIRFLWICVSGTVWLTFKALLWLSKASYAGAANALLFAAILFDEWRQGPPPDEEFSAGDEAEEDEEEGPSAEELYELALARLGLREPFTEADLKKAFREAIKQNHTDVGGRQEDARAINLARELIRERKGWR